MRAKANLFGHAIHQMMVVFPLGLLIASIIFDIIGGITGATIWHHSAFWMIAAGGIGGLIAAAFGLIDWLAIPAGSRAKKVGLTHAGTNVVALVLFFISWLIRLGSPPSPAGLAYVFSAVGTVVLLVGGWLGGELIDRLGVGIDEGAHINAPSSIKSPHGVRPLGRKPIEEH